MNDDMQQYVCKSEPFCRCVGHVNEWDECDCFAGPDRICVGCGAQMVLINFATAEAVLSNTDFAYGVFYDCETFIIKIQSLFETHPDNDSKSVVLKVVGNIKEEDVRQANDDGVTQTVSARSGIARVAEVEVPNPVFLAPFRTFREITQPLSPFVLRMKKSSDGSLPKAALFEADGGKWKLDAIKFIKELLEGQIEKVPIIA